MAHDIPGSQLELWGGIECTLNRVAYKYIDQLALAGHHERLDDLNAVAALGIKTMRYPVLWERHQPLRTAPIDWSATDKSLSRLRALRVRPVLGLVHHGSGPPWTSLVDDSFAEGLATYAREVAQRYPWVDAYTPINEPLTTARFSCLYGHWYPHARDRTQFCRALLNQCKAVVLAMRAIREVNPSAQLIQTEDLGKCSCTADLAYQAIFENERRWVTWDLLSGQVDARHPMWDYCLWCGVSERELAWFLANRTRLDLIGINYYITSERFLDSRLSLYPAWAHGGNDQVQYADVETVRARSEGIVGIAILLREAWDRYRLPVAVTEAHLGCSREEQLRWIAEVWTAAQRQKALGVDVRAVTAWALLGIYDWDSLVTCQAGHYEPGCFDLRSRTPRPTAIASLLRQLSAGKLPEHPVLYSPGWWRRPSRLLYASAKELNMVSVRANEPKVPAQSDPILISGAGGTLGQAFARMCQQRGLAYVALTRAELDITSPAAIRAALERHHPWAVINAAGFVRVDDAELEQERCFRENTWGPGMLAKHCAARGVKLVTFSSDLVFSGSREEPYLECDPPEPLNTYGQSKHRGEVEVLRASPDALVIRTSAFFGPWDQANFMRHALDTISRGRPFAVQEDAVVSPTYVPDLVHACLDLLIDDERGIWHLANQGAIKWADFARKGAELAGLDSGLIQSGRTSEPIRRARRPAFSALSSERGLLLPPLEDGIQKYVAQWQAIPLPESEQHSNFEFPGVVSSGREAS
jgi:dTDP-4-dehydrorhamnose reductase